MRDYNGLELKYRLRMKVIRKRKGEDSMWRRVRPLKRSMSWVNSVLRQFLPNGLSVLWTFPLFIWLIIECMKEVPLNRIQGVISSSLLLCYLNFIHVYQRNNDLETRIVQASESQSLFMSLSSSPIFSFVNLWTRMLIWD